MRGAITLTAIYTFSKYRQTTAHHFGEINGGQRIHKWLYKNNSFSFVAVYGSRKGKEAIKRLQSVKPSEVTQQVIICIYNLERLPKVFLHIKLCEA